LGQQNNLKLENLTDTELHRLNARHPRDGTGRQRLGAVKCSSDRCQLRAVTQHARGAGLAKRNPPAFLSKMAGVFALTRPKRLFANHVFAFKIASTSKNKRRKRCAALYLRASADWN
jgi:hypothetical protein